MKIKCPKCQTHYNISIKSEDISEKGNKVLCQKCSHPFFIRKKRGTNLKTLMGDIKNKFDSWDEKISEAKPKEQTSQTTEQLLSSTESASRPVTENQGEVDKILSEAPTQQLDKSTKDSIESQEKEQSQPVKGQVQEKSDLENKSEASDQEDIDKLFAEAVTEQLDSTSKEGAPEIPDTLDAEAENSEQEDTDKLFAEAETQQLDGASKEGTPETPDTSEAKAESSDQEDIDKLFAEAVSEQLDSTSKEGVPETADTSEVKAKGPEQAGTDKVFAEAETQQLDGASKEGVPEKPDTLEVKAESSDQEDIDKLFAEAVSEQPDSTSKEGVPETQETSEAKAESSDQEDIDKLFAEAVSEQLDSTSNKSVEETSNTEDESKMAPSSQPEKGDANADGDISKSDKPYSIESDQFQNDLENLLGGEDDKITSSSESSEATDTKTDELATNASVISEASKEDVDGFSSETFSEEAPTKPISEVTFSEGDTEGSISDTIHSSEEGATPTEVKSSDTDTESLPPEYAEEGESKKEYLKERLLFYKDMVVFFFTDKQKMLKILIPAGITIFLISFGGFWYFNKSRRNSLITASVSGKANSKMDEAGTGEPAATTKKVKAEQKSRQVSTKESNLESQSSFQNKKIHQNDTIKKPILGINLPKSSKKAMLIHIGSIVPLTFDHDETRVMSVNIKLTMNNQKAYNQIQKGFPVFEDRIENIIKKYFDGKFYKDIHFVQGKLKKELQEKLNQKIVGGKIKKVELEDFLIQ